MLEGVGLGLVLWLSLVVGARAVGMEIAAANLAAATAAGNAARDLLRRDRVRCSARRPDSRARATAVTAAIAVAAYLVNGLAPLVGAIEPFRRWSLFYHYAAGDPLRNGFAVGHGVVLLAVAVVASAAAPLLFARRDLGT